MTEKEILKEVVRDDDIDDDLDKEREKDFQIIDESFQCLTGSVIMTAVDTLSIFGMFASVKDNVMALASKIETL